MLLKELIIEGINTRYSLKGHRVFAYCFLLLISCARAEAPESVVESELSRDITRSILKNDFDSFVKLVDSDEVANMLIHNAPMVTDVIRHRRIEMLHYLLDHGLDLQAIGKRGRPLAFFVMTQKNDEFLEIFLDHGLDPNTTWGTGTTMATMALAQNRDRTLSLLLEHGANPNTLHPYSTLLTMAVRDGNIVMVKVLLSYDADPHVVNKYSESTACDFARENRAKHPKIWKLMKTLCDRSSIQDSVNRQLIQE